MCVCVNTWHPHGLPGSHCPESRVTPPPLHTPSPRHADLTSPSQHPSPFKAKDTPPLHNNNVVVVAVVVGYMLLTTQQLEVVSLINEVLVVMAVVSRSSNN